jgi:hypothetical protein
MFTTAMDRSSAQRLTLAVGALAGVGVVGVGALAVGGEGRLPQPPAQIAGVPQQTQEGPESPSEPVFDPGGYAGEVGPALSAPFAWAEVEDDNEGGSDGEEPIAEQTGDQPLRYLGSIIGPDRRLAILSIDGRQRILAQGAGAEGVQLVRVEDDRVIVRRNGGIESVGKAERTGPTYTILAATGNGDNGGGSGDGLMGVPGRDGSGVDADEMRRRLEERRNERLNLDARDARLDEIRRNQGANKLGTPPRGAVGETPTVPTGAGRTPRSGAEGAGSFNGSGAVRRNSTSAGGTTTNTSSGGAAGGGTDR